MDEVAGVDLMSVGGRTTGKCDGVWGEEVKFMPEKNVKFLTYTRG